MQVTVLRLHPDLDVPCPGVLRRVGEQLAHRLKHDHANIIIQWFGLAIADEGTPDAGALAGLFGELLHGSLEPKLIQKGRT